MKKKKKHDESSAKSLDHSTVYELTSVCSPFVISLVVISFDVNTMP